MSSYQELVSILKEILINRFYPKPEFIKGLLGDGLGNVLVPGRPDYNFARFNRSASETFEVFNKEVSQPVDGTPVLIGSLPWQPGLVQVVGIDWESYLQTGWGNTYASIQAHASTHEWPDFSPGSDYMRVFLRSIFPLQGYGDGGTGSMTFTAYPYQYDYTGTNSYWPGTPTVSLGPTRPPTGTMRYMGVYLNPATNALGVVTGSSVTFGENTEPPYPAWPLNVYPISYARVYGGQAYFTERDIKDARRLWNTTLMFTGTSAGGGGSGGWPNAGKAMINSTEYSTITAAHTAASAGDIIKIGQGTFTEDLAVSKAVTLVGLGPAFTTITGTGSSTINITAAATLRGLTITNTGAGILKMPVTVDAANVTIEDCIITKTGASTTGIGIYHNSGTGLKVASCEVTVSGATNNWAYYNTSGVVTATFTGGRLSGSTLDVNGEVAGSTLFLYGTVLVNSTITYAGTVNMSARSATADILVSDNAFIGLGSAAGRIEFDNQATDEINILDANVGIGTSGPVYKLEVAGEVVGRQFLTNRLSGLADDTATNFSVVTVGNRFIFFFVTNGGEYFLGVDTFNGITTIAQSGCSVVAGGGTLTGTTGPDGTINLRDNAGVLYVENRRGTARNLGVMFAGSD